MAPLSLVLGPAASGKTTFLVERATQRYAADAFAPTLALVPTVRHADQLRKRLVEGGRAAFALEASTIRTYARRLLAGDAAGDGPLILAAPVAAELLERLARARIQGASGGAAYFAPIASEPGLATLLQRAVAELLQDGVTPSAFAAAAVQCGDPALGALAEIYEAYAAALEDRGWADERSLGAIAAQRLASAPPVTGLVTPGPGLRAPLVLVDGFQFLRHGEVELVAELAARAEVLVALDPSAGARAAHTVAALRERVPGASPVELNRSHAAPEETRTTLPDTEGQLRAIARDIKQRLAEDPGLRPSDCAVALRQVAPQLALARQVFTELDLPFDPAAGEPLTRRPFGVWLLRLLRVAEHGWRLADLVAVLRSGYVDRQRWGLGRGALEVVARFAREQRLWSGLPALRRVVAGLQQRAEAADQPGWRSERLATGAAGLDAALAELEPLLEPGPATPGQHAERLDAALFGDPPLVRRDVEGRPGLDVEVATVRGELQALRAIDEALGGEPIEFAAFVARLEARLERPSVVLREAGGVLLAPLHTLHGLRFRYVAVGGLAEGEFPAPRHQGALLDERARSVLREAGLDLPPEARASEDELWQTAVSRSDGLLSLWRPHIDDGGRPRAASYYFDTRNVVENVMGAHPEPGGAASRRELALALARGWAAGERRRPPDFAAWPVVRESVAIEQLRRSFGDAGRFEGVATAGSVPRLTDATAQWSASRLESYRTCPFQFFARYALRLSELDEELETADAATRGTVVHEILEATLHPLVEDARALDVGTVEEAVARLRDVAPLIWNEAPARHGFGRAALWRVQLAETLEGMEALLRREAERNTQRGVTATVGTERIVAREVDAAGAPLRLYAQLDRLDVGTVDGEPFAQVVDYKSGREIPRGALEDGSRLQLQLYARLAREELGIERVIARYAFLDPRNNELELDTANASDEAVVNHALLTAAEVWNDVSAGDFRVAPRVEPCPSYCAFRHVCRVNQFSRWKQWA